MDNKEDFKIKKAKEADPEMGILETKVPVSPISSSTKLSTKGQLVVPKEIRELLSLDIGDEIEFTINENKEVVIKRKEKKDIMELFGSLPPQEETSKSWDEIRKEARENYVKRKYQTDKDE